MRRARRSTSSERGSAMTLAPAGFLVLLLLGALAVDSGAVFLGQRDLQASLQAAANDAAGAAVSDRAFYDRGRVRFDAARAAVVVCQDLAAQVGASVPDTTVSMAIAGDALYLEGHGRVRAIFGSLVPGFGQRPVSAQAAAVAAEGPGLAAPAPPPPAAYVPLDCPGPSPRSY